MKFLPVILAGLIGLAAGVFAGRSFSPAPAPSAGPTRVEERVTMISGGQESSPGAPSRTLDPKAGKPEPLTMQGLRAELTAMESGGLFGMSAMRKWADLQERLKVSDIATLAAEMSATPSQQGREAGLSLVFSTFAESDPQAAWNLAVSLKQSIIKQSAIMAVVSTIAQKDPSLALAMADSLAEPQLKRQIRSMAVSSLAQKDPQRALSLATESSDGRDGDYSLSMIFHQWARKDPEGAKAAVSRLSGRQADQARMALVSALAQQDPQAAWTYASGLPTSSGNTYSDPRVQVIQNWAQNDPQAALKAALTIGEPSQRGMAVATAVNAWAGSDFPAALKYAISVDDPGTRGQILQNLSRNPNANRKELLAAVMDHVPPGDNFQQAVSGILTSWAQENPAEAAAAAMELPPGRAFSNVASQIASQWISSAANKQDVFDWARNLPEGEARENSLRSVFSTWSRQDPQAAMRALSGLAPGERKNAVQAVASGWSQTAPEAVLQWSSSLTDASERADVVRAALSQWAGSSPESAAKFVERMPGAERSGPMESVVSNWASRDTASAAAWLDRQPSGPTKDAALRTLARKVAQEDPEAALTWARGISEEKDRIRQTESIARDWLRQDPSSARSWISTSTLPEETRKRLLK